MDSKHHSDRDLKKTSPSQLSLLMGLNDTEPLWSEADHAAIFRHLLDSPIPDHPGHTFGKLLGSQHPDLDQLRHVKDFAKMCRADPTRGLPQDLATALYYTAIAAAHVRCGKAISQLSDIELRDGIDWALARNWLPEPIKHLFSAYIRESKSKHYR